MPTETDLKLAERIDQVVASVAGFRIEAAGKFAAIETELRIIRKLGTWLLGGVFGLVAALITGAATVGWSASAVVSDVRQQTQRLDNGAEIGGRNRCRAEIGVGSSFRRPDRPDG